jgi:hypothetical protein
MKQVVIFADRENKFLDRLSKWWRWLKDKEEKKRKFSKLSKNTCEIEKKLYCFERHADCE